MMTRTVVIAALFGASLCWAEGKKLLVLPDWKTCPSSYSAPRLIIHCDPMLLVEITDFDPKVMPSAPDAGATPAQPGHVVLTAIALYSTEKARRMACTIDDQFPELKALCGKVFAFFSPSLDLKGFQDAKSRAPWGASLADAANEAQVRALLDLAQGPGDSLQARVGDPLVLGPGLWQWLAPQDPALSSQGTVARLETASGPRPMRVF